MNICVYGIGGIGGAIGGLLCNSIRSNEEVNIHFIARGNHLHVIRENGLQLQLPDNKVLYCRPTTAHNSIQDIPAPDVIFLCVKSYDLPKAVDEISQIEDHKLIVIPLLNGFDIYERIRSKVKKALILPACIYLGGRKLSDGKCGIYGPTGMLLYGADPMRRDYAPSKLISFLSEVFNSPYMKITWLQNPYPAIWQKYIFNVSVNLMNAYSGKVLGEILSDNRLRQMTKSILAETVEIVYKIGAPIPQNAEDTIWDFIEKLPCETKSSYAVDIENSRNNEGEIFGTAISELGKKVNVKTYTIENVFREINRKLENRKQMRT